MPTKPATLLLLLQHSFCFIDWELDGVDCSGCTFPISAKSRTSEVFGVHSHKRAAGVSTLNTFAIVGPCAVMRDLAAPWNCCGSTANKQMSAGIVQQALPVLFETHGKKRRAASCQRLIHVLAPVPVHLFIQVHLHLFLSCWHQHL